jgi:hypothetical protein
VLRDKNVEAVGPLDGVALAGLRLAEWPMFSTMATFTSILFKCSEIMILKLPVRWMASHWPDFALAEWPMFLTMATFFNFFKCSEP